MRGGVFNMYEKPESPNQEEPLSPNEGDVLEICDEAISPNEGACFRFMVNRNRQMSGRV